MRSRFEMAGGFRFNFVLNEEEKERNDEPLAAPPSTSRLQSNVDQPMD